MTGRKPFGFNTDQAPPRDLTEEEKLIAHTEKALGGNLIREITQAQLWEKMIDQTEKMLAVDSMGHIIPRKKNLIPTTAGASMRDRPR